MINPRQEPTRDKNLDALTWALLHSLAFALATVAVKALSREVPVLEQIFSRAVIGLCVVLISMRGETGALFGSNWPVLLFRGLAGFVGVYCMFYTVGRLPLLIAMILTLLTPVFVMGLGAVLLKERISPRKYAYSFLALVSVFVVVYPFNRPAMPATVDLSAYTSDILIGLGGSIATAAAFVSMRAALKGSSVRVVVLYFMGCNALLSLFVGGSNFVKPSNTDLLVLLALGVLGVLSDVFKTRAYKHAVAGIVSVLSLMSVVFAAIFGWIFFSEAISLFQLYGVLGLLVSITLLTLPEQALKRAA